MFKKLKAKIRYKFDNLMAKGTIALVAVLFLMTASFIILAALIAVAFGNLSFTQSIWAGIMHTIDAGTITGTDTTDIPFLIIMSVVTLCGLFITSILIGIITTGFEERLNSLKKGNSEVIEKNHTLILGFNDNIYTIISELVIANESSKDECIVILSPESKEFMEESINDQINDLKTTRIVCRTGSITEINMLKRCSIATCRSVIINENNDFITTKAILAINNYFDSEDFNEKIPCVVASINDNTNFDAATIASEGNVEIMLTEDIISRIIAQTCRQSGLSEVMTELFNFDGDEMYFENYPQLKGCKFGETLGKFEKAVVLGYKRNGKTYLNPSSDTILTENDYLLLIVEDNNSAKPSDAPNLKCIEPFKTSNSKKSNEIPDNILILGTNRMLYRILQELDEYSINGTIVTVADEKASEFIDVEYAFENITLRAVNCDTRNRTSLDTLAASNISSIVLLSSDECDTELSDAQMLLKLIHLRDISEKNNFKFNITSEMKNPTNQKLARVAKVNDFVIGNYIVNMMMAQISENRNLAEVFRELLQAEGNEIYINNVADYLDISKETNFYSITEIVKQHEEIVLGYKKVIDDSFEIIINPQKSNMIKFSEKDCLIVLSNK